MYDFFIETIIKNIYREDFLIDAMLTEEDVLCLMSMFDIEEDILVGKLFEISGEKFINENNSTKLINSISDEDELFYNEVITSYLEEVERGITADNDLIIMKIVV